MFGPHPGLPDLRSCFSTLFFLWSNILPEQLTSAAGRGNRRSDDKSCLWQDSAAVLWGRLCGRATVLSLSAQRKKVLGTVLVVFLCLPLVSMAPPWAHLLLFLFASVQLCEIPAGTLQPIKALNSELLSLADDLSQEPSPSTYVGLRLSKDHNWMKEDQYLNRLKETFEPQTNSTPSEVTYHKHPGTGRLALYLLALRAACHNMDTPEGRHLVTQLKLHLYREKKQIDQKDKNHPITNYYQYSLGILALCIHNKRIDPDVIRKLLSAEHHNRFHHHGTLSVDTEAMAGMVFLCLAQASGHPQDLLASINKAVHRVKAKILQSQNPEGVYGNIYSSPLAMQFLSAAGMSQRQTRFSTGMAALTQSLQQGDFRNALVQSQLLPALYCKSYLDLAHMTCQTQPEDLALEVLSLDSQLTNITHNISVRLEVRKGSHLLYSHVLEAPLGSSLLDVMKAAAAQSPQPLSFETQETLSGPMLTGVMGVNIQDGERKYWKVLQHPNRGLEQGIAEYIPQDQEHIILKLSSW